MPKNKKEAEIPIPPDIEEAVPEINDWEQRCAELSDQNLRLRAEFDNYRKRSQKEREALFTDIRAESVKKLLPVIDNLERAVTAPCADDAYAQGVQMTLKQCLELFASMGAEPFGQSGDAFDPNLHDAIMHIEDENFGPSCIAEVLQTGYRIGDKVLRHAMVRVAN